MVSELRSYRSGDYHLSIVFYDAVEIEGEEDPDAALKTAPLTQKTAALEQENNQVFHENQVIKERMEKLKLNRRNPEQKSRVAEEGGEAVTPTSDKANSTIQIAMARLEDEFCNILIAHTSAIEAESLTDPSVNSGEFNLPEEDYHDTPTSTDNDSFTKELDRQESSTSNYRYTNSIREVDLMSSEAIYDLRCIAERMISAGYLPECIQVYDSVRKSAVDSSFRKLGIEKLNTTPGKYKNIPKLPLVKASALAVWYVDANELENKVIGSERKNKVVEFKNVNEWKFKVEKEELGEMLLAQYAQDYESLPAVYFSLEVYRVLTGRSMFDCLFSFA